MKQDHLGLSMEKFSRYYLDEKIPQQVPAIAIVNRLLKYGSWDIREFPTLEEILEDENIFTEVLSLSAVYVHRNVHLSEFFDNMRGQAFDLWLVDKDYLRKNP